MASEGKKQFSVAVLGAAGGIGQPLSLLLKTSPYVSKLTLYDVLPVVSGVGADLSHIESGARVVSVPAADRATRPEVLREAMKGVEVAVIPAGVPRKPGMTRDDLFKINAGIVKELIEALADVAPECYICIISNPVNSTVPIAAEVLKKKGVYNKAKLFGVSTLDVVRANTFIAEKLQVEVEKVNVTVIGGHSGVTILPLLSEYSAKLSDSDMEELTTRIQNAGTEVVEAKQGAGSATLSMAYAGARFATSLMKALSGEEGVAECTYIDCDVVPQLNFFATRVLLGRNGVDKIFPLGELSAAEKTNLDSKVIPELKKAIEKGEKFVSNA